MPLSRSLALLTSLVALVAAQNCQNGAVDDGGNWYCSPVKQITYTGWSGSGSYNKITNMDSTTGACSSVPFAYSGSMSPMDEELSLHFRGPLHLKQFAFYAPSSSSLKPKQKAKAKRSSHHNHNHAHFHEHNKESRDARGHDSEQQIEERGVGDWVTATINGVVVSWINEYSGVTTTAAAVASTSTKPATTLATSTSAAAAVVAANLIVKQSTATVAGAAATSTTTAAVAAASSSAPSSAAPAGSWSQEAYYNAESNSSFGVTFLTHFGGSGSGVWDSKFGLSLSYSSPDGTAGSASPNILEDVMLPSSAELVIMTDKACSNGDCGYYRPGNVAYHGFDGPQKLFLMEFSMPDDGTSGYNLNMPAIWALNAQIPRTVQYGPAACSCWTSGCGEFDLWEVLASGDTRCKSTLHSGLSGGDSDYFVRPTSTTIKVAVLMQNEKAVLKVLDSGVTFDQDLTSDIITEVATSLKLVDSSALGVSTFQL